MKKVLATVLVLVLLMGGTALADITVIGFALPDGDSPLVDTLLDSFENDYDYNIDYQPQPGNYGDYFNFLTTQFAAEDPTIDVALIDEMQALTYSRAGLLAPLDDVFTDADFDDVLDGYVDFYAKYDGHFYAAPGYYEPFGFCVNTKILEEAGIDRPTNEQEFIDAMIATTDIEKGQYGFVAPFDKATNLQDILRCFCQMFNGDCYDYTLEGTQKAVKFMYDLFNTWKVCSKDMVAYDFSTARQFFLDGRAAFYMNWGISEVMNYEDLDFMIPPTFENNKCFGGGWLWCINACSANMEEAKDFVKKISSGEGQITYFPPVHKVPIKMSTWNDERLISNPEMKASIDIMAAYNEMGALSPRWMITRSNEYMDVVTGTLQRYLLDEIDFDTCISLMQEQTDTILSK